MKTVAIKFTVEELPLLMIGLAREFGPLALWTEQEHALFDRLSLAAARFRKADRTTGHNTSG